jgi:hypothetical protein
MSHLVKTRNKCLLKPPYTVSSLSPFGVLFFSRRRLESSQVPFYFTSASDDTRPLKEKSSHPRSLELKITVCEGRLTDICALAQWAILGACRGTVYVIELNPCHSLLVWPFIPATL